MNFTVNDRYERLTDHKTAVVKETDGTPQSAVLRVDGTGETVSIEATDVPGEWRLCNICPDCFGEGKVPAFQEVKGDLANPADPPTCRTCYGTGRFYP